MSSLPKQLFYTSMTLLLGGKEKEKKKERIYSLGKMIEVMLF